MNSIKKESPAIIIDRFFQRLAIGMFILGLMYAISAANYVVEGDLKQTLSLIKRGLSFAVIIIVLPQLWKLMRLSGSDRAKCFQPDSYIVEMYKHASTMAFALTFVALIILNELSQGYFTAMPTAFFFDTALWLTVDIFALTFFISTLASDGDEMDMEDEA